MLPISFLTDYGRGDEFVGVCHGVMQRVAPGVVVVDVTHEVPEHDIRRGALTLLSAIPFLPQGVHVAVVDPGVGGERRPVALRCDDGNLLVGPDNGLLLPAARACGGVAQAVDLADTPFRLQAVSPTFHGRDLFAPVAAHLALGAPLEEVGVPVEPGSLRKLELPAPTVSDGRVQAQVMSVDRFGNLQLNVLSAHMEEAGFELGERLEVLSRRRTGEAVYASTFEDVGVRQAVLLVDSSGHVAVAVNQGRASGALGIGADAEVVLQAADDH